MSSLPGYDLEDFVAWNFDLTVDGDGSVNPSLSIAEAIGTIPRRKNVSRQQIAEIVAPFEPYRESVEYRLSEFSEETQSWRDYSWVVASDIPQEIFDQAKRIVDDSKEQSN